MRISLSSLRPRLDTCHFWFLSSPRAQLKVLPQAKHGSTCINLQTAPCSVTAGTSSPSNANTRRAKFASVSKGARLARTSVTRRSSRKSSVFEPVVAWSSKGLHLCRAQRAACSQDGQRMALLHAPNAAPFWNKLGFEHQLLGTCENFAPTYQCWLWTPPAWPGHLGVGAYGSQIGVHMCGERPAAVIAMHAAGNNFWAWPGVNCFQVVKVSKVGCQEKVPTHQPSFSRRTRQAHARRRQSLTS